MTVLVALLAFAVAAPRAVALKADELLLVYNQKDPRSWQLAEYYARVRQVPADRLCPVNVDIGKEEIPREAFNVAIRKPIREFLQKHDFGRQIRCIVLFYGLPIRIGPKLVNPAERALAAEWHEQLRRDLAQLQELIARLESLGGQGATSKPATTLPADDELAVTQLVGKYTEVRRAAGEHVAATGLKAAEAQQQYRSLVQCVQAAEGGVALVGHVQVAPESAAAYQQFVEQVRQSEQRIQRWHELALTDPARAEIRQLILQNHGLVGHMLSLSRDIVCTRCDETVSSLDSELTLVLWDDYPLYRWMPNLLSWEVRSDPASMVQVTARQRQQQVLMACRIDGPSITVARRIIDDSIAADKRGPAGKVYLDARGLRGDQGLGAFDEDLRSFSTLLQNSTDLPVRLDNKPAVFAANTCPDAMLYCGWYSLRKYVPAMRFVPGAVGYHIASFEAVSIHTPGERGWVSNLLKDGIAATLGPVAEPYVHAFPKPSRFLGLLLTGRFSLAECYAYSNNLNSWMMLLIGDPLYNPFATRPHLKIEDVYPAELIPTEFKPVATRPAGGGRKG